MTRSAILRTKNLLLTGMFAGALVSFAAAAYAATATVVYSFQNNGKDGLLPGASLIVVNGTLYGTTSEGGSGGCENGCGTVFSINAATGAETVLHSFAPTKYERMGPDPWALVDVKGTLFGTTRTGGHREGGMIYSLDPGSDVFKQQYYFCKLYYCSDGTGLYSGLLDVKGMLYGSAYQGGTYGGGVVFSFDPDTRTETVLHAFGSDGDGSTPEAALLNVNGVLYGTTSYGGESSNCPDEGPCGTVFSVDPATGAESIIYSFCSQQGCADGAAPESSLIISNGVLYGTTDQGGTYNLGTAYSIDLSTGTETVLHSFGGRRDGQYPSGLVNVHGMLYGTTATGGAGGKVFSINPETGAERIVYSFCSQANCADGDEPVGSLLNVNGTLYGVTQYGGSGSCSYVDIPSGCGTVFAIVP